MADIHHLPPAPRSVVRRILAGSVAQIGRERRSPPITFRPTRQGVMLCCGPVETVLTEAQIEQHMALYQTEKAAAQAVVDRCEALFDALFDARCVAIDKHGWRPEPPPEAA